jgi:hypothetical protein
MHKKMSGENHWTMKNNGKFSEEHKKKLSEAKKGDKNPNKKGMTEEHKNKIRLSNIGKLRNFTNEQFWKILELKDKKMTQEKVRKMFVGKNDKELSRGTIANIWRGKIKILPSSTEEEIERYKLFFPEFTIENL